VRVMIVENGTLIALAFREAVREAGFDAAGMAASGAEALARAPAARPDVALIDLRLADGLTGNYVAVEFAWKHRVLPILVAANLDLVSPDAKLACFALLPKPVSGRSVKRVLDAAARMVATDRMEVQLGA